ncbi:virulence protein RhuM/Fic/DOC family protein [Haliovirga abyssi]|uniref:Cytochrome c n=1 Tax=Haliovirga abyssi TaxID=2996794 RepID=A0AAU9DX48_9FUSO|nr:virulence protein RhuM/Fic/DOC family protein [Haliovirga abyssi]BDU50956.1 cytochrome c [Haliovirga abyssi]
MENKEVMFYKTDDGDISIDVNLKEETVWLSLNQISDLFERDKSVISRHIRNIYNSEELMRDSTVAFFATVQSEGGREVKREIEYFNLDLIISVGYRVNSKRGTQFRIWATNLLKQHLINGYTINEKRLKEQNQKLKDLQTTMKILNRTIENQKIELGEAKGLLKVISEYTYALTILDEYDHQILQIGKTTKKEAYILRYEEAMKVIESMKSEFPSDLFGNEKDDSFKGSLGAIYQTAFGEEVYPSIEEKASNLLYFVVKNHSFSDGNKRIAAAIFIYFMRINNIIYKEDGSKRIADNALVAITLMIAESRPQEKDIIVKVLVNLINEDN